MVPHALSRLEGLHGLLRALLLRIGHGYSVFGGDIFVFIARDEDDLVFVSCQVTQNGGRGFSEDDADRVALERLVAAYLAEHLVFGDVLVRFDVVSMLIVGESRALFWHHLNALDTL